MSGRCELVVSLDPIAALREMRKELEPDPVHFALQAEMAGADGISVHLRIDRRHIQERDIVLLVKILKSRFYLKLSPNQDFIHMVNELRPANLVLVAERRDELATEAGLDLTLLAGQLLQMTRNIDTTYTRIFAMVDPDLEQIRTAAKLELSGVLINVRDLMLGLKVSKTSKKFNEIRDAVKLSAKYGLETHLANGVSWDVLPVLAEIPGLTAIHIGHQLAARAMFNGIEHAVTNCIKRIRGEI